MANIFTSFHTFSNSFLCVDKEAVLTNIDHICGKYPRIKDVSHIYSVSNCQISFFILVKQSEYLEGPSVL